MEGKGGRERKRIGGESERREERWKERGKRRKDG